MLQCRSDHLVPERHLAHAVGLERDGDPGRSDFAGYLAENGDFAKLANGPVKNGADEKRTSFGIR